MYKFGKTSNERLNNSKVHPKIRQLMNEAIKYAPVDFTVIETVRTLEQQKINVSKGVSKNIEIKTHSFNK